MEWPWQRPGGGMAGMLFPDGILRGDIKVKVGGLLHKDLMVKVEMSPPRLFGGGHSGMEYGRG